MTIIEAMKEKEGTRFKVNGEEIVIKTEYGMKWERINELLIIDENTVRYDYKIYEGEEDKEKESKDKLVSFEEVLRKQKKCKLRYRSERVRETNKWYKEEYRLLSILLYRLSQEYNSEQIKEIILKGEWYIEREEEELYNKEVEERDNIIYCKEIREEIIRRIKEDEEELEDCKVSFIQVGENKASEIYVRNKIRLCEEVGIKVNKIQLEEGIKEEELIEKIRELNEDKECNGGIMVQLPLPKGIDENKIINEIKWNKDLDGFSYINKGKLMVGEESIESCTPAGIIDILNHIGYKYEGSRVVILGRSNIVGKPLANLLINKGSTVTVCNSHTGEEEIKEIIKRSDVIISAIGKANYINKEFIRGIDLRDKIGIDVGINRDKENKLCGDISKEIYNEFKYITPVPGGVGIMTVLNVIKNIIKCYKINKEDK